MPGNKLDEERRSGKWFGISFVVPLPWILGLIAAGLLQAGIFYSQFTEFGKTLDKIEKIVTSTNSTVITHTQQITDHDRRLDNLERKR